MDTQSKIHTQIADLETTLADHGISVTQFSKDIGIAQSNWARWKTGQSMPSMRTWGKIEDGLAKIMQDVAA